MPSSFFPNGNPIGGKIPRRGNRISSNYEAKPADGLTVVGVVEQARLYDVHQDGRPQIYIRTEDWGFRPLSFVVRTGRDPSSIIPEARAALRQVDSRVAMGDVRTMEQIVEICSGRSARAPWQLPPSRSARCYLPQWASSASSRALSTRRRHEMAVRLALGADHERVLLLVLGEGALLAGIGVLIGLPGIYAAGRLIRGVLVGISPLDPLTLAAVSAGLGLVTMAACYVPARRVLGIDPAQALRQD